MSCWRAAVKWRPRPDKTRRLSSGIFVDAGICPVRPSVGRPESYHGSRDRQASARRRRAGLQEAAARRIWVVRRSPSSAYDSLMSTRAHPGLARLVARAQSDAEVLALILFGSRARHDASAGSDFDVCLVLRSEPGAVLSGAQKRLEYPAEAGADVDLAVFQLLPLAIRIRVLKEGDVLFVRDEDALYDLAARTVRAFEDFRHIHREYLDQVSRD